MKLTLKEALEIEDQNLVDVIGRSWDTNWNRVYIGPTKVSFDPYIRYSKIIPTTKIERELLAKWKEMDDRWYRGTKIQGEFKF